LNLEIVKSRFKFFLSQSCGTFLDHDFILIFMEDEQTIVDQDQNHMVLQDKLREFGLTKNETRVYMFLNKNQSQKAIEISRKEKIPRTEIYKLLSNLKAIGIVEPSIQKPTTFSAVPIERALVSIIIFHEKKILDLNQRKQELVELWNLVPSFKKPTRSNNLKLDPAIKSFSHSKQFREEFKGRLKKIRQQSIQT